MVVTQALLSNCVNKNRKAQHELFKLCFPYLMGICMRFYTNKNDAADTLNEAFYKILTNLHAFNPQNSFKAWIRTITVRTIINKHKKEKKYQAIMAPTDFEEEKGFLETWDFEYAKDEITADEIQNLINKLPENEKTVFNLFVLEDMSHDDIASLMEIPAGTSRWILSNARKKLKVQLQNMVRYSKALML